jgi:hypothetical protein
MNQKELDAFTAVNRKKVERFVRNLSPGWDVSASDCSTSSTFCLMARIR